MSVEGSEKGYFKKTFRNLWLKNTYRELLVNI